MYLLQQEKGYTLNFLLQKYEYDESEMYDGDGNLISKESKSNLNSSEKADTATTTSATIGGELQNRATAKTTSKENAGKPGRHKFNRRRQREKKQKMRS